MAPAQVGRCSWRAGPTLLEMPMARITVEDCTEKIPNRFNLVQMAAIRAKQIKKGARPLISSENKEVVTALREIAAGYVEPNYPEEEVES